METEMEMETQTLSCCTPSKMHMLLAFIPRHLNDDHELIIDLINWSLP